MKITLEYPEEYGRLDGLIAVHVLHRDPTPEAPLGASFTGSTTIPYPEDGALYRYTVTRRGEMQTVDGRGVITNDDLKMIKQPRMPVLEAIHIFENCQLVGEHFTPEGIGQAYVEALAALYEKAEREGRADDKTE